MSLSNHPPLTYLQKLSLPEAKIKWGLNLHDSGYLSASFKRLWKGLQSTIMFYLESSCPTRCSAQSKWLAPKGSSPQNLVIHWEPSQHSVWHTLAFSKWERLFLDHCSWAKGTDVEVKKQKTNTEGKSESWEALDRDHQKGVANSPKGSESCSFTEEESTWQK